METPLILLISLTTLYTATGVEVMETHHLYGAIGSSVRFPAVNVGDSTVYDLIRVNGSHVVACHGVCNVRSPYTERGHFYQNNGTFVLNELRAEDSGEFNYNINLKLKGRIHLRVMAPVTEPVLLKQEAMVNGSQCLVTFECRAEGDGPFIFTLLRNDNEIMQNVTSPDNSSSLDDWHPKTSGIFSCKVANAIGFQTSPGIQLLPPVTLKGKVTRMIVIAFLCHWFFALCILLNKHVFNKLRKKKQEKKVNNKEKVNNNEEKVNSKEKVNNNEAKALQSNAHQDRGPEHRDTINSGDGSHAICPLTGRRCPNHTCSTVNKDKILRLINRTITIADNIVGFLKELAVLIISLDGEIIPAAWGWVPGVFLLCRVIYWIFFFVNRCKKTNVKFSSAVELFCNAVLIFSNVVAIPAFCIAILVMITIRYRPPCGAMDIYPAVLPAVCLLIFIFYLLIKPKLKAKGKAYIQAKEDQPESQHLVNLLNGDIGHPEKDGDIGHPEKDGDIGHPENNGDIGHPDNYGDIGHPENDGDMGHPEKDGDIGHPENYGDIGHPENNRNPNGEGPVPPGIVGNPNVDEAPKQSEVSNEGDPEDQMIPKPKDGQLPEEVPCNRYVGAGHCLLTIEKELVDEKGPVSNG
ncbi:uncharacterized protein LOC143975821 isoform X2 [Lithobates pipiens]